MLRPSPRKQNNKCNYSIRTTISNAHSNSDQCFKRSTSIDKKIFIPHNFIPLEKENNSRPTLKKSTHYTSSRNFQDERTKLTKCEITEFLPSLHSVSFLKRCLDAPYHHRTNAHSEHSAKLRTVDRNDLPCVFAIYVKCGSNGLRLE